MKVEDIKFRGLRLDKTGWEIGLLTYKPWGLCIQDEKDHSHFSAIIPETVGQFTGLKDNNGVDIYIGDKWTWRRGEDSGIISFQWGAFTCNKEFSLFSMVDDIEIVGNIHEQGAN